MDSNPLLNPVGSLPPQVYWRRRALAGILAVLVIWLAWSVLPGKGGGANAAQPRQPSTTTSPAAALPSQTPAPAATSVTPAVTSNAAKPVITVTSPKATTTATSAAATTPKCTAATLKVTLTTDHTVYAAGANPHFVLTVANSGSSPCLVDVGTTNRGFLVTSGTDRIWSSADCTKASPNLAIFKAKDSVSYSHNWTRQRSSSAGCAAAGTSARPGTYKVVAHLGDLISSTAVFRLS